VNYKLPFLPQGVCVECLAKRAAQRTAFINKGT
jgi:type VI secretion system secreted protein VgrG